MTTFQDCWDALKEMTYDEREEVLGEATDDKLTRLYEWVVDELDEMEWDLNCLLSDAIEDEMLARGLIVPVTHSGESATSPGVAWQGEGF